MKPFIFKKKVGGSLTISLESYNATMPARDFFIEHNQEQILIPYAYALGLFVSPSALGQHQIGVFTVENFEELVEEGAKFGLVFSEQKQDSNIYDEVRKALKTNDVATIKEIIKERNVYKTSVLLGEVNGFIDKMSASTIKAIEEGCNVSLTVED